MGGVALWTVLEAPRRVERAPESAVPPDVARPAPGAASAAAPEIDILRTQADVLDTTSEEDALEFAAEQPARSQAVGVVLDAAGQPVADVQLGWFIDDEASGEIGVSNISGAFQAADVPIPSFIAARDPSWVSLARARVQEPVEIDLVVGVARAATYAGRIVSASGQAVPQATIDHLAPDLRHVFPLSEMEQRRVRSDAQGAFALERVPACAGARLRVQASEFETAVIEVPAADDLQLHIVLRARLEHALRVEGVILLPGGEPAHGAKVSYGLLTARTDEAGAFLLEPPCPIEGMPLIATARGWQPIVQADIGARLQWEPRIGLRLAFQTRSRAIEGVVLDADETPLKGVRVSLVERTPRDPWFPQGPDCEQDSGLRGGPLRTDERGRFALHGLGDRRYTLVAEGRVGTQRLCAVQEVDAGASDVRLLWGRAGTTSALEGVLLDGLDAPLAEANLVVLQAGAAPNGMLTWSTTTDSEGRFRWDHVPAGWVKLRARAGQDAVRHWWLRSEDSARVVLRWPQLRRVELQIEEQDRQPDALRAVDASGRVVAVSRGGHELVSSAWTSLEPGYQLILVEETATALELFSRGRQLARFALVVGRDDLELRWP